MVAVLERALQQCSPMSLHYNQLSQMLQARLKEVHMNVNVGTEN